MMPRLKNKEMTSSAHCLMASAALYTRMNGVYFYLSTACVRVVLTREAL